MAAVLHCAPGKALPESVTISGRVTHGGGGEMPAEMEVLW